MSDDYTEIVIGKSDFLVLVPKEHVGSEELTRMSQQLPPTLRGRVLICEGFDMFVGRPVEEL